MIWHGAAIANIDLLFCVVWRQIYDRSSCAYYEMARVRDINAYIFMNEYTYIYNYHIATSTHKACLACRGALNPVP